MSLKQDLQFALETAKGAAKIVLGQYGKVERLTKTHIAAHEEAVTEADRASQRYIVAAIKRRFAADGVIGEESETGASITFDAPDPNGRIWVIDPIDGTNNFISGLGNFAVCIGLIENGMPVLGVVHDVTRDLPYAAAAGEGAWCGNARLLARQTPLGPSSMLMMTSNLVDKAGLCPPWVDRLLCQTDWKVRMLGSAALEAVMVAAGVAHGAITLNGKLWDVAAPAALVLEAGGLLTSPMGKPIFPYDARNYQGAKVPFLAAGPAAHAELLAQLGGAANPQA